MVNALFNLVGLLVYQLLMQQQPLNLEVCLFGKGEGCGKSAVHHGHTFIVSASIAAKPVEHANGCTVRQDTRSNTTYKRSKI